MKTDSPLYEAAEFDVAYDSMDRKVIRVEIPPTYAGITAALRRAFEPASGDMHDCSFDDLIRKLS